MRQIFGGLVALAVVAACSSNSGSFDGGTDGGRSIGDNPNVTPACQTCMNQSSSNDCATQRKNCTGDTICTELNTCVNKCAGINSGCVNNCENAASSNAVSEWVTWYNCVCADCGAQCNSTFCGLLTTDAGSDADVSSCLGLGAPCSMQEQCCASSPFCIDPGGCVNCVPSNYQCSADEECCSAACDPNTGTCF